MVQITSAKIVSLAPFLTDLLISLEQEKNLVGIVQDLPLPQDLVALPRLSTANRGGSRFSEGAPLNKGLAAEEIDLKLLAGLGPTHIVTSLPSGTDPKIELAIARKKIEVEFAPKSKLFSYVPRTLEGVLESISELGRDLGVPEKGRDLSSRMKAQFMDWGDNFYDRMKNKRVAVISSIAPLKIAGWWVPDMIRMCSAHPLIESAQPDKEFSWEELKQSKPDVLVFAPRGVALEDSAKSFLTLEKVPGWEEIPAVKRGEVFFADGTHHFYRPSMKLVSSMAILMSAVAGFESGYITDRDSFYKLRWLEMQRHRFTKK